MPLKSWLSTNNMVPAASTTGRKGLHRDKSFILVCVLIALMAFITPPGFAQTLIANAAGSGENLENAGASARVYGMGTAFVGIADDVSALFFNPAGLSGISLPQFA